MRSEAEIQSSAREGKAFSNGTEWEIWSARWCDRCRNNDEETEKWCPIITVALVSDKTPREWTPRLVEWEAGGKSGSYEVVDTCTEFDERREYDGDGPEPEPEPPPVVEGQMDVFEVFADQVIQQTSRQAVSA